MYSEGLGEATCDIVNQCQPSFLLLLFLGLLLILIDVNIIVVRSGVLAVRLCIGGLECPQEQCGQARVFF
jgi:hypothetical protein